MNSHLEPVKFTTREVLVTREMTIPELVLSVRGATAEIARTLGVSHSAVSRVLRGKAKSKRVSAEIRRWVNRKLKQGPRQGTTEWRKSA